jgi:hypothetical protein
MSSPKNDDLTVLVFKDNSVARTFRVPLHWISRLGLTVGILTAIAVLGVFLSGRFYWSARQSAKSADLGYLQQLEHENSDLRSNLKQAQSLSQNQATAVTQNAPAAPIPTVTVTVTPAVEHAAEPQKPLVQAPVAATIIGTAGPVFSALPSSITADLTNSPITLYEPHVKWINHTLKVNFFIQYTKEDKGNQQGRIILLARGPETVMAYPTGIFNPGGQPSLIDPQHGEYFSVSRIREVKADFKSANLLNEVEIILLSTDGKLLVHEFLKPEISKAEPAPRAAPKAAAPAPKDEEATPAQSDTTPKTAPANPAAPTATAPAVTAPANPNPATTEGAPSQ